MRHPDAGFVVGLDREQRVRYYEWWRKYILLRRATWAFGAITVLCWFLLHARTPLSPIARAVALPAVLALIFFALWGSLLDCPRCGNQFRAFGRDQGAFSDECQGCGLTKTQLSAVAKPRD
jgi:hypothetical protein